MGPRGFVSEKSMKSLMSAAGAAAVMNNATTIQQHPMSFLGMATLLHFPQK